MSLRAGNLQYEWIDNWAKVVDTDNAGQIDGRTHGVQETSKGEIVVFVEANPSVLFFNTDGELLRSWGHYPNAHGLTLVVEDGVDYLWLVDCDLWAIKTTLDGKVVQQIGKPAHPIYEAGGNFAPTWIAVNEERFGGNGDIWYADGYGSGLVHRFDKSGKYLATIDGSTGAGHFDCPHGIAFDYRDGGSKLFVADRGNCRIQIFDAEGKFVESFGENYLVAPDCFSFHGGMVLVPELFGRVTLLDNQNQLIGSLGVNDAAKELPNWPNLLPSELEVGKFSSPHGGTFDHLGNIFIVEWIIGGRITKLAKTSPT